MKLKAFVYLLAVLLLALPVIAQEPPKEEQPPATTQTEEPPAEATQTEAAPPPEAPAEDESMNRQSFEETFAELLSTVDTMNKLKVSGYIQAQYVNDERSVNELTNPTTTKNLDQFSIRRGRVKFTYQFSNTSRFVIQPDITTSGVVLKDGYVEYIEQWTPWHHTLTAGQFNWPFGFEIGYSSSQREMPERSRVIRTLFPGERDRGVQLSGLGMLEKFKYQVAIVNGTGTNQSFDFNKRKDLVGRVGYTFGPLDAGASVYRGSDLVATATNPKGIEFDKERQGVDFQWFTPIEGLGIRGEYITGKQAPNPGSTRKESFDVKGWYFYAIQNIGVRHQLVLRVDDYDGNTDVKNDAVRTIGGSYIFHWDGNSKVMLAYEQPKNQINDPDDNVWTIRYQYSF
ncbi:MAG TPA: porin [Thermoanaerobaculia bacterium]|nr:porin [Thermoanaerobaculia bacterium]